VILKAKGFAKVSWSEGGSNNRHTYRSSEEYYNFEFQLFTSSETLMFTAASCVSDVICHFLYVQLFIANVLLLQVRDCESYL
ncbi:hypothetical protein Avbf_09036, partial [Armadillidium vulgare]